MIRLVDLGGQYRLLKAELEEAVLRVLESGRYTNGQEVASFEDFVACGGESGAKEAGKLRSEGKEYVVREGDVILFRFNV